MYVKHLEIHAFKAHDSWVLSRFTVSSPQSSLSPECSQHSRKKPHTQWLAACPHSPDLGPGNRGFTVCLCGGACSGHFACTVWVLWLTPSPLAWLHSASLSCFPFSESIIFIVFLAFHFILSAEVLTISFVGLYFSNSVQFSSVTQSCPTLCDPMNRSTPGLPVHHQLPEFTQTHIHRVGDAIQLSHPLSSPSPPAPNRSQHQNLFQWVNSLHEVAKVLEFQL